MSESIHKFANRRKRRIVLSAKCGRRIALIIRASLPADEALAWYFLTANDMREFFEKRIALAKKPKKA